jgi:outer membrane protein assembly factor BamA
VALEGEAHAGHPGPGPPTERTLNLRPLALLLLIAPLAACAGGGPKPRDVAAPEIELAGNHAFDAATLRAVVRSTECDARHAIDAVIVAAPERAAPAPCHSPEDIAGTLKFFYLDKGYLGADVRALPGGKAGRARIVIEEGERFQLGALDVVEADVRPADPAIGDPQGLAPLLSLHPGEPYSGLRVRAALETLRRRYVAAGYAEANVTPRASVGVDAFRIDLCFEIDRGVWGPPPPWPQP